MPLTPVVPKSFFTFIQMNFFSEMKMGQENGSIERREEAETFTEDFTIRPLSMHNSLKLNSWPQDFFTFISQILIRPLVNSLYREP